LNVSPGAFPRSNILLAAAMLWCVTGGGALAEDAMTGSAKPFGSVPFMPDHDVACLAAALETGNPVTGPSTWILRAPPGCVVPWHSHTAEEQLIVVRGSINAEMGSHPPTQLEPGGFAVMGSHMAHEFACQGPVACVMFVIFDRAYDIKWGRSGP
jgi:mannose-6-phosphate isomerase-like protein (cupin superfamily)